MFEADRKAKKFFSLEFQITLMTECWCYLHFVNVTETSFFIVRIIFPSLEDTLWH